MATQDIQLNSLSGDLLIVNGELVIGNSETQNIHDIVNDNNGEWKEHPTLGVGLLYYLNSNIDETSLNQVISTQLQNDGFNTQKMVITYNSANSTDTINLQNVKR